MARIETDPYYTAPTFPRATAGTDLFKKEDVQGVAAALSTHDHAAGKGLAVTRLDTLNQNLTFSNASPKLIADGVVVTPFSANQGGSFSVVPNGTGVGGNLSLFDSSTTGNSATATFTVTGGNTVIQSSRTGAAAYGGMYFYTGGAPRMSISAGGDVDVAGSLTVTGGQITLINSTTYVLSSGGNLMYRAGSHYFQNSASAAVPITCGTANVTGVVASGSVTAYGGAATHAFVAPNIANASGQGMAYGWVVYSSRDFKTAIAPLEDPLAIVMNPELHGVSYNHVGPSEAPGALEAQGKDAKEATIVETPSIGFIADDWLPHVPEVVMVNEDGEPIGMDYNRIEAITFEAMKQLATQVGALEGRIASLEGTSTT